MNILITNALILPMTGKAGSELCFRGAVGIENDRITLVTDEDAQAEAFRQRAGNGLKEIDGSGKLLMPGLINLHNHVAMTLMRSMADDIPLMPWLYDHIWPFEAKLNRDDIKLGAQLGIAEMLLGGTTTFIDMYWSEEAVGEAVEESGIRAVLAPTFTDTRWDDFLQDFEAVAARYAAGQHPRITMMVAPHSAYSCSTEHLLEARSIAERFDIGIHIHVSETRDEDETVRERFGKSPVEYLYDLGLLNERSVAAHCVHVNERDMAILLRSRTNVAHNPQSNMKISSGIAPVGRMLAEGINVGIGTDGPCSNNDLDMWDEMRSASFLQKVATFDPCITPAYEVLRMATVNGAKALGREGELGVVSEGALADLILIDIEKPHYYPRNDIVANLVYCGQAADVDTVIVNGQLVVENRRILTMDVPQVCRRVDRLVPEILSRE